jgi:hypothetical protein
LRRGSEEKQTKSMGNKKNTKYGEKDGKCDFKYTS